MSGALARLRDFFKDDLLVPVGRKMVLTPLAKELAQPVRQLLVQAEARTSPLNNRSAASVWSYPTTSPLF